MIKVYFIAYGGGIILWLGTVYGMLTSRSYNDGIILASGLLGGLIFLMTGIILHYLMEKGD